MIPRRLFCALTAAPLAANGKIRAAVVGTGHAHANGKISALKSVPRFELAGICEPHDEPRTHPVFQGVKWLTLDEVLEDRSIRLVAVESRVQHNLDLAEKCVAAGKFVHLDKAPGEDLARLRRLFDQAAGKGLTVQMGYQWRYLPAMRSAIEAARKGWLGEIRAVRATINKVIPPSERRQLALFRGGMMFELGCHMVDRVVDTLGKPRSVSTVLRRDGADDLADNCLAIFEYDKALAEIYIAAHQPTGAAHRTFEIQGTNGTATVRPFSNAKLIIELHAAAGPFHAGMTDVTLPPEPKPSYSPDLLELADVANGERKPAYGVAHDLAAHEALLRACGFRIDV
jgi:predicted dehydrogenase